jgi:hypothetical protein
MSDVFSPIFGSSRGSDRDILIDREREREDFLLEQRLRTLPQNDLGALISFLQEIGEERVREHKQLESALSDFKTLLREYTRARWAGNFFNPAFLHPITDALNLPAFDEKTCAYFDLLLSTSLNFDFPPKDVNDLESVLRLIDREGGLALAKVLALRSRDHPLGVCLHMLRCNRRYFRRFFRRNSGWQRLKWLEKRDLRFWQCIWESTLLNSPFGGREQVLAFDITKVLAFDITNKEHAEVVATRFRQSLAGALNDSRAFMRTRRGP